MPQDAPLNDGAALMGVAYRRVSQMQAKLHRWAVADPGRRFDDLMNLMYDPATLAMAFDRVAGNTGARTAGSDGLTVAAITQKIGIPVFLEDLRTALKRARSGRSRYGNARSPNRAGQARSDA